MSNQKLKPDRSHDAIDACVTIIVLIICNRIDNISPETPLLPITSSPPQNQRRHWLRGVAWCEFNVLLDAIANGYNAIIVSDYDNIEGALEAQRIAREKYNDSITVILAMEYKFLSTPYAIYWWFGHPPREKLRDMRVDGFEVINGDTFDWQTYLFVQQNNMLMHIRRNYDRTKGDENKFFIDATGTRPRVYPKKNLSYYNLLPMNLLADYWTSFYSESKGMYSFQSTFCHQRKFVMHWKVIFGLVSGV
ncbi:polymerase/histidinol phosphatase-like protein [Rhizophagus irregularis DAOM 181602=DAOM 197198]|nr:polymerase/histidinol phosphatase-like protein [Rhizophagus irregularis DAOM 181602=DAOM 197198]